MVPFCIIIVCTCKIGHYLVSVSYIVYWLFQMSSEWFVGFVDGTSQHTCNMTLFTWVIYAPSGQMVASGGAFLGSTTNNVPEYNAIAQLWDATLHGITCMEAKLDSQLVVFQINGDYQVRNPTLLRQFLRVRLLERNFEYI